MNPILTEPRVLPSRVCRFDYRHGPSLARMAPTRAKSSRDESVLAYDQELYGPAHPGPVVKTYHIQTTSPRGEGHIPIISPKMHVDSSQVSRQSSPELHALLVCTLHAALTSMHVCRSATCSTPSWVHVTPP